MEIAVVIASTGRAAEIKELLWCLEQQTKPPQAIILSVATEEDLPVKLPQNVQVVYGERGLTLQRNRGIRLVPETADIIIFYDDDFVPGCHSLAGVEALFKSHPNVVSATGMVLADGVKSGGIGFEDSLSIVRAYEMSPSPALMIEEILWAYGCNMAFRASAMQDLWFDEVLILHGWQEDMDFAARISKRGAVVKSNAFYGVHRGVNKGRSSGVPAGFSQIVNPIYLVHKGAMTYRKALTLMMRNFLANHGKIFWPEPFVDRRGRALGNWYGLLHLVRGRADPEEVRRHVGSGNTT